MLNFIFDLAFILAGLIWFGGWFLGFLVMRAYKPKWSILKLFLLGTVVYISLSALAYPLYTNESLSPENIDMVRSLISGISSGLVLAGIYYSKNK